MAGYHTEFVKIHELQPGIREAMSRLYLAHYAGSRDQLFQEDLSRKTEALLVYLRQELVGFTVYELYTRDWQGQTLRIIYSGDTIVERRHWGQQTLAFSWIARTGQIARQQPQSPLYWFLIVKGHRTYRYLPAFSRSFHPHWSNTRDDLKSLADELAREKFPEHYCPERGVISFAHSQGHLRSAYAQPTDRERQKPAVRFFLQQNPGYLKGDELVCLCRLSEENLKPLARRLFHGTRQ